MPGREWLCYSTRYCKFSMLWRQYGQYGQSRRARDAHTASKIKTKIKTAQATKRDAVHSWAEVPDSCPSAGVHCGTVQEHRSRGSLSQPTTCSPNRSPAKACGIHLHRPIIHLTCRTSPPQLRGRPSGLPPAATLRRPSPACLPAKPPRMSVGGETMSRRRSLRMPR